MSLTELSFFSTEGVVTTGSIPLLDGSSPLSTPDLQNLFLNWTAYERYEINHFSAYNFPSFDDKTIIDFFWEIAEVCAQISQQILREVTLFRKAIKKRPII
jgi:hypothetical protein